MENPSWEARAATALRHLALNEDAKAYVLQHLPLYQALFRAAQSFIGGESRHDKKA